MYSEARGRAERVDAMLTISEDEVVRSAGEEASGGDLGEEGGEGLALRGRDVSYERTACDERERRGGAKKTATLTIPICTGIGAS